MKLENGLRRDMSIKTQNNAEGFHQKIQDIEIKLQDLQQNFVPAQTQDSVHESIKNMNDKFQNQFGS